MLPSASFWRTVSMELVFSNFKKKNQILSFKKIKKKYQSVGNELVYMCVNFHHEIPCILSSVKITKLQIWEHEQYNFQIFQILSNFCFLLSLKYNVFCIQNVHARSVRSVLHPDICFLNSPFILWSPVRLYTLIVANLVATGIYFKLYRKR
jgi:hypothetical protein